VLEISYPLGSGQGFDHLNYSMIVFTIHHRPR